jgi:hypothetical protein
MAGNIVFLGFGIAGASGLPVLAPLIWLAVFLGARDVAAFSLPGWPTADRSTSRER